MRLGFSTLVIVMLALLSIGAMLYSIPSQEEHYLIAGNNRLETGAQARYPTTMASVNGADVFKTKCRFCHGESGQGQGIFPSLVGAENVKAQPERMVRIVLHGMSDKIVHNGKPLKIAMPPWKDLLSSEEIAAVTTYIRSSWGNKESPVKVSLVEQVRAETKHRFQPWSREELRKLFPTK